ncbi:hypothetical protein [Nostoc sp.]|uniref:hypothetical protein n=1 Tax=Nostoc sp. TaxID=1180 RepID=UPI002FF657D4
MKWHSFSEVEFKIGHWEWGMGNGELGKTVPLAVAGRLAGEELGVTNSLPASPAPLSPTPNTSRLSIFNSESDFGKRVLGLG